MIINTITTVACRCGLRRLWRPAARLALVLSLSVFYIIAAHTHAERVNTSKARADQTGYMVDAQVLYHNWHGTRPERLVDRNRMPAYGAFLALFYDPTMSDPDFFVLGRNLNIALSLVLLILLAVGFSRTLPTLVWTNLILVVGFGYFVFKAGYVQAELLFYTVFFFAFLACVALFRRRRTWATIGLAVLCGTLLGAAHWVKAAMLPFVAVFLVTFVGHEIVTGFLQHRRRGVIGVPVAERVVRLVAALLVLVSFLAVLSPYLLNSKRVFGHYFYNVNSTFYVWYDHWVYASNGTFRHGDHVGWPTMPESELPGPLRYWHEHTMAQIGSRLAVGLKDMAVGSYQMFWFLGYLTLHVALTVVVIVSRPQAFAQLIRQHAGLTVFLVLYACVYLLAIAFYNPTSGSGTTRFLLAHMAPALFMMSGLATRQPFSDVSGRIAGVVVTTPHVHLLLSGVLGLDILFTIWPRLMATYGGF